MFKVGYVDDEVTAFRDYKTRLKRRDIELDFVDNCSSLEDIYDWILNNTIECLIVDHKLTAKYDFHGTKVVAYINSQIPDLPCIILTNYPEDSTNDNLVVKNLIFDRNIMSSDDLSEIVETIKQAVNVFRNRMTMHTEEYAKLYELQRSGKLTAVEEETFFDLYKILRAYGEVDDIPTSLLKTDVNYKIDSLMNKLDKLIDGNKG